jgi:hypothetical protein
MKFQMISPQPPEIFLFKEASPFTRIRGQNGLPPQNCVRADREKASACGELDQPDI